MNAPHPPSVSSEVRKSFALGVTPSTLPSAIVVAVLLTAAASWAGCGARVVSATGETAAQTSGSTASVSVVRSGVGDLFDPALASVQFGVAGLELTEPIVELGGAAALQLTFDVLGDNLRGFRYELTHCDADWRPSQLTPIDYLTSFSEADITDFDLSFNSVSKYVRYRLLLPNQYVAWTKSGNYLLTVRDDATGEIAMVLRFCVVEPLIQVRAQQVRPSLVARDRTHQEFDVAISLRDVPLENPRRTTRLTVLQNGDWRTGIYALEPRFIRDDQLVWDYQNRIVFPAMRPWRSLDLRTLNAEGGRVGELIRDPGDFSVTAMLVPDLTRAAFPAETRVDLNGHFVLEDFDNRTDLQAEYVRSVFTLKTPRDTAAEPLYLYGALTGYQLGAANRGAWNPLTNAYTFAATLKQGFYDYAYVSASDDGFRPDWSTTEGNWFQTENAYQFLLYYRPYGERYDRLVGYTYEQVNRP